MNWELDSAYSPTEKIDFLEEFGLDLYIKRDDKIHPLISGNKSRKLKYYIREFYSKNHDGIITFGGAFSNHLLAVAQACFDLKIPCGAIIRGNELNAESNPVLSYCFQKNMALKFIDRNEYHHLKSELPIDKISSLFPFKNLLIIPEGANTEMGSKGMEDIPGQIGFIPNYFITSVGTGATFSGLEKSFENTDTNVIGIAALKKDKNLENNEAFFKQKIFFTTFNFGDFDNFIIDFIIYFFNKYRIVLDPVYTAKSLLKIKKMAIENYFRHQSKIVFLHTGGITGLLSKKSLEMIEKNPDSKDLIFFLKENYPEFIQ